MHRYFVLFCVAMLAQSSCGGDCLAAGGIVPLESAIATRSLDDRDTRLIASFCDHIDGLTQLSDAKKVELKGELTDQPASLITDVLAELYPVYGQALEATDNGEVDLAIERLTPLAAGDDPFLSADASFFLSRILMNADRFEQALPHLERLATELAPKSVYQADVYFLIGVAQAGMLQRDDAIRAFREFLQMYPDAAERLRVTAWRKVQELEAIEAGQLKDVQYHMEFSRRRLDQQDTGEQTQKKQDRIVKMLGKLIKEEEKKECNASSKNSEKKPEPSENPSAPQESENKSEGKSDQGGSSSNPNGQAVEKSYDDSPASPWSRLRDRSRDPANNAIKEKLPARYRDIVEKYFEAANDPKK